MAVHRDQGIVERFNRTLSKCLSSFKYSQEMNMTSSERSREWAKRLPEVVEALNNEVTRLTGKKPVDVIKERVVNAKSSTSYGWFEREANGLFNKREISLQRW